MATKRGDELKPGDWVAWPPSSNGVALVAAVKQAPNFVMVDLVYEQGNHKVVHDFETFGNTYNVVLGVNSNG